MSMNEFSSHELFAIEDNEVPPVIRDCFIGLIAPFESLFGDGRVPSGISRHPGRIPDTTREPPYPASSEFKKDWIKWIYLELRVRLELGVRYYNFLGERLAPESRRPTPIILFLRKFRKISSGREKPARAVSQMWAGQIATDLDQDTLLRGQLERRFASHPILWIANPIDALSFSGYLTKHDRDIDYRLNTNSLPFLLTPTWSRVQRWQESVEHLIRASDAIVIANASKDGGIREEQELLYATNAMNRAFVTHPEHLESSCPQVGLVDDLTDAKLHSLKGADPRHLQNLAGWGHWAGLESLEYARQYIGAIDELWGSVLDSGRPVSPRFFAPLFTAIMALLIFRGELRAAATIARGLASAIEKKSRGQGVECLVVPGEFHIQDVKAYETLMRTSDWYHEQELMYRFVVGLGGLEGEKTR